MSIQQPEVSIITACLNAEASIERAICSVRNQTNISVEHIIIDGGSRDTTVAIIEKYKNHIAYFISEADCGISNALNKGINKAHGNRICILGADDWLEPGAIANVVKEDRGEDILHGKLRYWHSPQKCTESAGNHLYLDREQTINFPGTFIKRSCFEQWGVFNTNYKVAMDYELLLRFKLRGATFKALNRTLANMDAGGVSDKNWKKGVLEVKQAKDELRGKNISHNLYAWKQIMAITLSKQLSESPISALFNRYRKQFSMVKRESGE